MYQVKFDPNGAPLQVDIQYLGAITASYTYTLWEANSNATVSDHTGNNMNSQDDIYPLPSPVQANAGRLIDILSTLKNPSDTDLNAIVEITILQGNQVLDSIKEPERVNAGKTEINQIFINLIV